MAKKDSGEDIVIKGKLYRAGSQENADIYKSNEEVSIKFDEKVAENIATEVGSQAAQSGIQAVVTQIQTQAANLGASGLIAVGSAGAFQVEHMHDHTTQAVEKAAPMITELIETGTITPPVGHSKHGVEIPKTNSFLGMKVGDAKKEADAEKNKSDEQKAIEKAFRESVNPPSPSDEEKDGSVTSIKEHNRSMT